MYAWQIWWHGKTHTVWLLPCCMSFVIQYWFCHAIASLTLGERCADNWLFSYFILSTSEWIDLHQNFTDFVDLGSNYRWAVNVGHNPPLVDKRREDLQQFSGFVAFCRHLQISHSNIPNIWRHTFQVAHDQNFNSFSSTNILKTDPVFSTRAFNTIVQTTFCQI